MSLGPAPVQPSNLLAASRRSFPNSAADMSSRRISRTDEVVTSDLPSPRDIILYDFLIPFRLQNVFEYEAWSRLTRCWIGGRSISGSSNRSTTLVAPHIGSEAGGSREASRSHAANLGRNPPSLPAE